MNPLPSVKKHPQRTTALALMVFSVIQANLAMFKAHMPPLHFAIATTAIGAVMAYLAWRKSQEEA